MPCCCSVPAALLLLWLPRALLWLCAGPFPAEGRLLKRQRYVTGLADSVYEGSFLKPLTSEHLLSAFRQRYGESSVLHAQVTHRRAKRRGNRCGTDASNGGQFPEVLGAVVEFKDDKTAQYVDRQQREVTIEGNHWKELVLQMNEVGNLRQAKVLDSNRFVR